MTSMNQNKSNSVTLISGSPNVMSSSRRIGALVLDKLSERKFETNIIDLSTLDSEALLGRKDDANVSLALEKVNEAAIIKTDKPITVLLIVPLIVMALSLDTISNLLSHEDDKAGFSIIMVFFTLFTTKIIKC